MGKNKIEVGSVVRLKSGGPLMTVARIETNKEGETYVNCIWFVDATYNLLRDTFKIETLKVVNLDDD